MGGEQNKKEEGNQTHKKPQESNPQKKQTPVNLASLSHWVIGSSGTKT